MVTVIPMLALDAVRIIEWLAPPHPQPAEKRAPSVASLVKILRKILIIKCKGIKGAIVSEQSEVQFQTIHPAPTDGRIAGRL